MSDVRPVCEYRIVFNCMSCGALLSVDTNLQMSIYCPNCGAFYDNNPQNSPLVQITKGRSPSQWMLNGYNPTKE